MKIVAITLRQQAVPKFVRRSTVASLLMVCCWLALQAQATAQNSQTQAARPVALSTSIQDNPSVGRAASRGQAISVSGWWTISVKDAQGNVVQHREFENAITNLGTQTLVYLLSGQIVPGTHAVSLNSSSTSPCGSGGCLVSQSCANLVGTCFEGLSVTVVPVAGNAADLTLAGSFVAPQNGSIDSVASVIGSCASSSTVSPSSPITSVSPSLCNNTPASPYVTTTLGASSFTQANPTSLSVSAGQTVQVSVTFSFGSVQ